MPFRIITFVALRLLIAVFLRYCPSRCLTVETRELYGFYQISLLCGYQVAIVILRSPGDEESRRVGRASL